MKKIEWIGVFTFFFAPVIAQVDTMIWDYSKLQMKNQNYPDGYHVFKKEGVKVMEYLKVRGLFLTIPTVAEEGTDM